MRLDRLKPLPRRAVRSFAGSTLSLDLIAKVIFSLLPVSKKLVLTIDRTNWKFGVANINILMLGVTYKGIVFPLLFKLLDKRGNSNWNERRDIVQGFINIFGSQCIDCLVADRVFVGREWIEWLNCNRIGYYIRIRQNFRVVNPKSGEKVRVWHLFNRVRLGEELFYHKLYLLKGEYVYLAGSRLKNSDGELEHQILICFNRPQNAVATYKDRWQIETLFKAMKSSGFNIEDTHLRDLDRIERLVAVVCIALVWAYLVGDHKDINVKKIRILKHGHRAKSMVKYGLEEISDVIRPFSVQSNFFGRFSRLLYKFFVILRLQTASQKPGCGQCGRVCDRHNEMRLLDALS